LDQAAGNREDHTVDQVVSEVKYHINKHSNDVDKSKLSLINLRQFSRFSLKV
jgi:hypothetical protein